MREYRGAAYAVGRRHAVGCDPSRPKHALHPLVPGRLRGAGAERPFPAARRPGHRLHRGRPRSGRVVAWTGGVGCHHPRCPSPCIHSILASKTASSAGSGMIATTGGGATASTSSNWQPTRCRRCSARSADGERRTATISCAPIGNCHMRRRSGPACCTASRRYGCPTASSEMPSAEFSRPDQRRSTLCRDRHDDRHRTRAVRYGTRQILFYVFVRLLFLSRTQESTCRVARLSAGLSAQNGECRPRHQVDRRRWPLSRNQGIHPASRRGRPEGSG